MAPHLMTLVLALFALVVGAVVFGGTSLAYFLDQRRPDSRRARSGGTSSERAHPVPERSRAGAPGPSA